MTSPAPGSFISFVTSFRSSMISSCPMTSENRTSLVRIKSLFVALRVWPRSMLIIHISMHNGSISDMTFMMIDISLSCTALDRMLAPASITDSRNSSVAG